VIRLSVLGSEVGGALRPAAAVSESEPAPPPETRAPDDPDWRWQLRNRISSLTEIEALLSLTADERAGLAAAPAAAIQGGEPAENATWLRAVLAGQATPAQVDAVALNAGALAWVARRYTTLPEAVAAARDAMLGAGPLRRLDLFIELSHGT
jgi:anthranilate phosphoribosyltransferase